MVTIAPNTRLADVVTSAPSLARVLDGFGLDYCCGGTETLAEAVATQHLELDVVLDELRRHRADEADVAWSTMNARQLVDHLEATHHQYLRSELPRLSALADKVLDVHGERHPELTEIADCYAALRADLEPHLAKEEQVLFPMIRELAAATAPPDVPCGSVRNPISVMFAEHETAGGLLARLRSLTDGFRPPDDACASYSALFAGLAELEADTHLHVHKENHLLFPAVIALEDERAAS